MNPDSGPHCGKVTNKNEKTQTKKQNQRDISPQTGCCSRRTTWAVVSPEPKRNIILVSAASVVMS